MKAIPYDHEVRMTWQVMLHDSKGVKPSVGTPWEEKEYDQSDGLRLAIQNGFDTFEIHSNINTITRYDIEEDNDDI